MENPNEGDFLDMLFKNIQETEKLTKETRNLAIEAKNIAIESRNIAIESRNIAQTAKEESKQALIRIEQLYQYLIDERKKSFWQRLFS